MTVRLYYQDPYVFHFRARVVASAACGDGFAVELDRTCFYPEGGGQPPDTGTLGGRLVLSVREEGTRVVHLVDGPLESDEVEGLVDEARRRDHMEHHTGQHLLSAAFLATLGTPTVSMHLGELDCTIDLTRPALSEDDAARVEDLVNRVIREDRSIRCFYPSLEELERLTLRKSPQVEENIRIVRVEGFDDSPCCGTHCPSTGRVGLVKVRRWEHYKGMTRVHFLCGGRALRDYQWKSAAVNRLAEKMSVKDQALEGRVMALLESHVELERAHRKLRAEMLTTGAPALLAAAKSLPDGTRLVLRRLADGSTVEDLKTLADAVVREGRVVFAAGTASGKASLLFARSSDVPRDMAALLRACAGPAGGKGGGSPQLAQGGCPAERLDEVLATVERELGSSDS